MQDVILGFTEIKGKLVGAPHCSKFTKKIQQALSNFAKSKSFQRAGFASTNSTKFEANFDAI